MEPDALPTHELSAGEPSPDEVIAARRGRRIAEIVDIAARLFAERGYTATGIADLCQGVGLGRGALYYYIGSKEGLLVRIHDRVMEILLDRSREIVALDLPADEKLRRLGAATIEVITTYPDHCFVFMHEWRSLTGEAAEQFRVRRREVEAMVEAVLEEGRAAGIFRFDDLRLAVLGWFSLHNYTYHWYRPGGRYAPETIAETFHELFCDGLRTGSTAVPELASAPLGRC